MNQPDEGRRENSAPNHELAAWVGLHLGVEGPIGLRPFAGGQSNPTFELSVGSSSFVLRRKPIGSLLPSAHAIEREYRVLGALQAAGYCAPKPYAYCDDASLLGAEFYVMELAPGRIFWDPALPELARDERGGVHESQVEALAALHRLDPDKIGLGDFGRRDSYYQRQLQRWTRQYLASCDGDALPAMDRLIAWLPENFPPPAATAIVHGDFRISNIVFASDDPRVAAVLDWELATLGDPLADLTHMLTIFYTPAGESGGLQGLGDLGSLGIPAPTDLVKRYADLTHRAQAPDLGWRMAFSFFRLAAICQGIVHRHRNKTAATGRGEAAANAVPQFAELAWAFASRTLRLEV